MGCCVPVVSEDTGTHRCKHWAWAAATCAAEPTLTLMGSRLAGSNIRMWLKLLSCLIG